MTMNRTLASIAVASFAIVGIASSPIASASPSSSIVGDDNHDGIVMEDESGWNPSTMGNGLGHLPMEDEPGWNCLIDGNMICGPLN